MKWHPAALLALCTAGVLAQGLASGTSADGTLAASTRPADRGAPGPPAAPAAPSASEAAGRALEVGDLAPDFTLDGSDGRTYRLSDFRGKQAVVIAWFPKAFTSG
jgi:hypothetical protein